MEWLFITGIIIFALVYAYRTIIRKLDEIDQYVKAIHYRLKDKDENQDGGIWYISTIYEISTRKDSSKIMVLKWLIFLFYS